MTRKKLIEVALPLDTINAASVRENYIYRGNPSSVHKWWAQRPLAAARAVIFAQMVDDPSAYLDVLRADQKLRRIAERVLISRKKLWDEARALAEKAKGSGLIVPEPGAPPTLDDVLADQERQRLFRIIENLVLWESTTDEKVLQVARDEIWQSWRRACAENADNPRAAELFDRKKLPNFHDPFAGGGTLPLEAQRLGLTSYASDLNPVAVLIAKGLIELPPKFASRPPVNPTSRADILRSGGWHGKGASGLAEDLRYYGKWMREEAAKRIGHLYPDVIVTGEMAKSRQDLKPYVGESLNVVAWLWVRTVKSPNPAFAHLDVPLASTFMLSTKAGDEAYVEPMVEKDGYRFTVKRGKPKNNAARNGTKVGRGNFSCLMSGTPISREYIQAEGKAGRIGTRLMAVAAEGDRRRIFVPPTEAMERAAVQARPDWKPDVEFFQSALGFRVGNYGLTKWSELFTARQLVALATLSELVDETRDRIKDDMLSPYDSNDEAVPALSPADAMSYANAIALYLAFAVDKYAIYGNSLVPWYPKESRTSMLFSQQVLSMVWDFTEVNPFASTGGSIEKSIAIVASALDGLPANALQGEAIQENAAIGAGRPASVISTDPPYYDNIGYADLSDFFYVWLRRSLKGVYPELFGTVAVPKAEELVATPGRHGGADRAEEFFLSGMTQAMHRLAEHAHPDFPVTIYYAFKQAESDSDEGTTNTGWDTFLGAVIEAGFAITGTWPMRTERTGRVRDSGSNALASSIVLVCRPRGTGAVTGTRREFVTALKAELPVALADLQRGNIAPVDLAQAAIGPGMGVYTRFAKVLDAEGNVLNVRAALALINQALDEALAEQEGDFDADTRWALTWFEQSGFEQGEYGAAEQLSKSKNTSVSGMVEAGILASKRGKVRLLRAEEMPEDWDPTAENRPSIWVMVHQLVRALGSSGEPEAAALIGKLGAKAETARELAYRLYTVSERKKRPADGLPYNGLVQSWPELVRLSREGLPTATEPRLFDK